MCDHGIFSPLSSFFQSICVLGYCVVPLAVSLILCRIILAVDTHSIILFVVRFVFVILGFGWSTFGKYHMSSLPFRKCHMNNLSVSKCHMNNLPFGKCHMMSCE